MFTALILCIIWISKCNVIADSIEEIPMDFKIPPGAEKSTTKDHNKIIMCKVFLEARTFDGNKRYNLWDPNGSFDGNLCTHLIISWFNVDDAYEIIPGHYIDQLNKTAALKFKFPRLKIFLEIAVMQLKMTEYIKEFMKTLMTSPENNNKFTMNMKAVIKQNGYDGLHIGPQFYLHSTGNDFSSFVMNLRDEFHNMGFLLSTEIVSQSKKVFVDYHHYEDITTVSKVLDFVVVRIYDLHLQKSGIVHQAPLYSNDESIWSILSFLLTEKRLDPRSTILGIALHGTQYNLIENVESSQFPFGLNSNENSSSTWGYEKCSKGLGMLGNGNWKMYWDKDAKVPFIKTDKIWISLETPQSVYEKIALVAKIGLPGIMFRSSDKDDFLGLCGNITNPMQKTANFAFSANKDTDDSIFCSLFNKKTLQANYKPIVTTDYYVMSVTLNSSAEIKCTAEGNSEPVIYINKYIQGEEIQIKSDNMVIQNVESLHETRYCTLNRKKELTLRWNAINGGDLGKYSCNAKNSLGTTRTNFFLMQHDKPFVVEDDEIWIEETDPKFTFVVKIGNNTSSTILKHNKVIICEISKLNAHHDMEKLVSFDGHLCTHLLYGNISINSREIEEDNFSQLLNAKNMTQKFPRLKILLRLWLNNHQDLNCLKEFINQLSQFGDSQKLKPNSNNVFRRFGIHGFYLSNTDMYYTEQMLFANALRKEIKGTEEFSLATEITWHNFKGRFRKETYDVSQIFNMVVVRPYDFQNLENIAAHNSPLHLKGNGVRNVEYVLKLFLSEHKIPADKLIVTLPTFGYHYWLTEPTPFLFGLNSPTNNSNVHSQDKRSYREVCKTILAKNGEWKTFWDRKAGVPFAKYSNQFMTFENPKSIYEKCSFALGKGLLGVMLSFVDFDDYLGNCDNVTHPLLKTVNFAFNSPYQPTDALNTVEGDYTWSIRWAWISVIIAFCGSVVVISVVYARRSLKIEGLSRLEIEYFKRGASFKNSDKNPDNIPYTESVEIPGNCYTVDKTSILGMGAFGIVFKGTVNGVPVAVKSTKPGADKQYLISLLSELKINIYTGEHPYIVNLVGAHTTELNKGVVYIFVELCPLGNLQAYLRRSRDTFTSLIHNDAFHHLETLNDDGNVTTDNLLNWTYQIALALEHLSNKKVIHGDLAARNVLLFEQNVAKLTDFGLSRKLYEYSNYVKKSQEPLPWRWMAIESLRDLSFSVRSDMWSFGITVWEIFSLGEVPYPGYSWNVSFMEELIQNNLRLPNAKFATTSLYKFMLECWKINPDERPQPQCASNFIYKLLQGSSIKDYYLDISQPKDTGLSNVEGEMETVL